MTDDYLLDTNVLSATAPDRRAVPDAAKAAARAWITANQSRLYLPATALAEIAAGIAIGFADLTVGAIARAHGLIVATRNVRDFAPMGIPTLHPFAA